MAWAETSRPYVQVAAQAFDDVGVDVLSELNDAAIEVAVFAPLDLRGTFAVSPVLHEAFGVDCVFRGGFTSSDHCGTSAN
jgi:hypothetical protein